MPEIYITIGFLGSGKTTWAKNFARDHADTKVVSADSFRKMLNGEYKHLVELDAIITDCMVHTIITLLHANYNVIVDCGNLTNERREPWMKIGVDKRIAVLFPQEDNSWHVKNRIANPHWEEVDWQAIIKRERAAFEPINEKDFDEIIKIQKWQRF